VRDRPAGLREHDLRLVLAEGWRIDAAALRYAAVGGGSYHWVVRDGAGRRWFVTADDLDDKAWLGHTRPAVMAGLRSAMETALALRRDVGLDFVVAPVPGLDGGAVRPAGPRHAVAVFPFLNGTPGRFGETPPAAERAALTDMLAALHRSALDRPALAGAPVAAIGLARRADLDAAARRYADLTGRAVDAGLLEWYRLRWALDDISAFVRQLRSAHGRTADAEHAWVALKQTVTSLDGQVAAWAINC
jgi:spectinomycin phosphotransferase